MNKIELAQYLSSRICSKHLHISVPILGHTFGCDNYNELIGAIAKMNYIDMPIFVRQFTSLDSPVLFKENKVKYLSIKRMSRIARVEHIYRPIFVRPFTSLDSPILFKNNKAKYLPIKRIALIILHDQLNEVTLISKNEAIFSVNPITGEKIEPPQDLEFMDAGKLLDIIR
ncbi:MAG: hypothetical protein ACI88H_003288 [Cocleimonas sp.]|jgi:hypothetical protein